MNNLSELDNLPESGRLESGRSEIGRLERKHLERLRMVRRHLAGLRDSGGTDLIEKLLVANAGLIQLAQERLARVTASDEDQA